MNITLAAGGTNPLHAAAWGVYLHALAGERLAKRIGTGGISGLGLLPEIPAVMDEILTGAMRE